MRFLFFICLLFLCAVQQISGQEATNSGATTLSPNSSKADQLSSTQVNYFTGTPNISLPLHSYNNSNNGLSLGISLDYAPGGIKVGEQPTSVGLGWNLNATGTITRTVRGMPDDIPIYGYIYSSSIPTDFRSNGYKYYRDSLDSQPDVFVFNCPGSGSGKFFLGKNGNILITPSSKLKVIPAFKNDGMLQSFRIITESGLKYDFNDAESYFLSNSDVPVGYASIFFNTAWYLTRIISPFNTDTIKFTYNDYTSTSNTIAYPQWIWKNYQGVFSNPSRPDAIASTSGKEISLIEFPDHSRVDFIYGWEQKNTPSTRSISKVKISDTTFRFGYLFGYDTSYIAINTQWPYKTGVRECKLFLTSLTPYTSKEKQVGYRLDYHRPYLPPQGSDMDTVQNKRDHWGFFNGADNGFNVIPNVEGYTSGAYREPNSNAIAGSLYSIRLPQGGTMWYNYEPNDRYPYVKQEKVINIDPSASTQNNISLSQVFNTKHRINFELDRSITRQGSPPVSGSGDIICKIKSLNGATTYATHTFSLNDLYYLGLKTWNFNLANGNYLLETQLSTGTSVTGYIPINVRWENKSDTATSAIRSGGLRISSIGKTLGDSFDDPVVELQKFSYVLENGKSSGFLGEVPTYHYVFKKITNNVPEDLTYIFSDPISPTENVQGSIVGYSRVEVTNGLNNDLGKTVYEFTDLKDVNSNYYAPSFPYTPQDIRSWGLGLTKKVSVFDSSGLIVKKTVNQYYFDTVVNNSSNFKGLKLGHSAESYMTGFPSVRVYIGEEYYPGAGRAFLQSTYDTLFHLNGTINTTYQSVEYDTNYNVVKTITGYDRSRGLNLEVRNYYPYNYTIGGAIGELRDSGILTTVIASEKWITGDNNPRLVSGSISTFKELSNGMIKPDTLFVFESNKPIIQGSIGQFGSSTLNRSYSYFKPQAQYVSYNSKGIPIEIKDLTTGRSNSIIMDYDNFYPVAKISNAIYTDVAYSSFESDGSGNWTIGSSSRDLTSSLTGKRSYNLSNGNISKSSLNSSKAYLLTVWAKTGAIITVNGNSLNNSISAHQGWNLYQVSLSGISNITISGTGLIDELRLHPKSSNMETQTYEPMVGVLSTTDANNGIIYNEYDGLNRLKIVRNIDKNIIKQLQYSDTVMLVSTIPDWIGIGSQCSPVITSGLDTIYKDINPFSDSAAMHKPVYKRLECSCSGGNPQYKEINGTCEQGTWAIASSVYKKVEVEGTLQWRWVCTYRYCFSDGSQSTYYNEGYYLSPCSLSCGIEW